MKKYLIKEKATRTPDPPKHLRRAGRKLWRGVLRRFEDFEATHDLMRLSEACHCMDRIDEARRAIDRGGAFFLDRFQQPKEHPAHKVERDNKILFLRFMRELGLDLEPPESRPPALY